MVTDFAGNELQVGDYVAFSHRTQTELILGTIVKINMNANNRYSVSVEAKGAWGKLEIRNRVPHNVIKIEKEAVIQKILCK